MLEWFSIIYAKEIANVHPKRSGNPTVDYPLPKEELPNSYNKI
jgi:hypothetical protein